MTSLSVKLTQCFVLAKHVVHYYNVHTDGDDARQCTSVENIQRIVERMTGKPVEKYRVPFEGERVRGNIERYDDRFVIHVRRGQTLEWDRFTVIKELCHALMDSAEEYSPHGVETLRELVSWRGLDFDWEEASEVARCERLAELMALELIYPFEYREGDKAAIAAGATRADVGQKRGVPLPWVERALLQRHIDACRGLWEVMPSITAPLPPPL